MSPGAGQRRRPAKRPKAAARRPARARAAPKRPQGRKRGPVVVVAFGGSALVKRGERGTPEDQVANARTACRPLVKLLKRGQRLLLVPGNAPQVGRELLRAHVAHEELLAPLDVCVASTQGTVGYFLELALRAELVAQRVDVPITSVVTLVVVNEKDGAFGRPSKPIGNFVGKDEADELHREKGWTFAEEPGRGWRKVVPSPSPREVVDARAVHALLEAGHVVIAGGGGGVPVVRRADGTLEGIEAVVDKDRTASLLGRQVGATELWDLTTVDFVYRDFASADRQPITRLTAADARSLGERGQFPPGSMGPKVDAACDFVEGGGESVLITSMERLAEALDGRVGTRIVRD